MYIADLIKYSYVCNFVKIHSFTDALLSVKIRLYSYALTKFILDRIDR